MATKLTQAAVSVPAQQSKSVSRPCDAFAVQGTTLKEQRRIATIAYGFWLVRAFRNGSPQEDWLKALRQGKPGNV